MKNLKSILKKKNTGQAHCSITYNGQNSLCNEELPGLKYKGCLGSEALIEMMEAAKVGNQCPRASSFHS